MFFNRFRCPYTGKRALLMAGDTHEEAVARAPQQAVQFHYEYLGTFFQRWGVAYV